MRRDDLLEFNSSIRVRELKQLQILALRQGIENAIENGTDEEKTEGFEQSDQSHENYGSEKRQRVREEVAQDAGKLAGFCRCVGSV